MNVNINRLLYALSYALDCVETELVGVSTGHSKRVAYLSIALGEKLGLEKKELLDLATCAVLHDNALTQYIKEEYNETENQEPIQNIEDEKLIMHCIYGENNLSKFPFQTNMKGAILYHHERADGKGPFHKLPSEVCVYARLIHFSDALDRYCHLDEISEDKYTSVKKYLIDYQNEIFEEEHVKVFFDLFPNADSLKVLKNNTLEDVLVQRLEVSRCDYQTAELREVANFFAGIIDHKSKFTMEHSLGIAQKAEKMGVFYGYSQEKIDKLFIAGALHDIGKLAINNNVLEKPDKLTTEEYRYVQNHAWYTYQILKDIDGFEDICSWASNHHEKLNGKGYPFGKTSELLGKEERLFACLDIYQALSEKRPYKDGMNHSESMQILYKMVESGELDSVIVKDIDEVFSKNK